jgi:hypothetical protein
MSYTFKNIYTKPNAEVNINFWDEDGSKASAVNDLIDTYFDAGKITQKPVKVVDGLTETYTTIFKDESSCNEFLSDGDANDTHFEELQKWCTDNSISWSIEKE